jgi:hypothetical protein
MCPDVRCQRRPGGDDRCEARISVHVWCTRQMRQSMVNLRHDCGCTLVRGARLRCNNDVLRVRSGGEGSEKTLGRQVFYLRAVAGFLRQQMKSAGSAFAAHQRTILDAQYAVEIASGPALFDPNTFDELLFAAEMNFEGLINRHRRFGFGLALVGFRKNTLAQPAERFFPKVGTAQAVTTLMRFEHCTWSPDRACSPPVFLRCHAG